MEMPYYYAKKLLTRNGRWHALTCKVIPKPVVLGCFPCVNLRLLSGVSSRDLYTAHSVIGVPHISLSETEWHFQLKLEVVTLLQITGRLQKIEVWITGEKTKSWGGDPKEALITWNFSALAEAGFSWGRRMRSSSKLLLAAWESRVQENWECSIIRHNYWRWWHSGLNIRLELQVPLGHHSLSHDWRGQLDIMQFAVCVGLSDELLKIREPLFSV